MGMAQANRWRMGETAVCIKAMCRATTTRSHTRCCVPRTTLANIDRDKTGMDRAMDSDVITATGAPSLIAATIRDALEMRQAMAETAFVTRVTGSGPPLDRQEMTGGWPAAAGTIPARAIGSTSRGTITRCRWTTAIGRDWERIARIRSASPIATTSWQA